MGAEQKVVIVTGASQGIGAGLVKAYRDRNFRVVATSRSIRASDDPDIATVQGDIADVETARRVIALALERFGRIDTLVNNAGIFIAKPFDAYTPEDYDAVMSTNVNGFFHITQRALTEMSRKRSGHVVNITASLVDRPRAGLPAAMAALTKGGLNAVTKSLAIEYAPLGIRVNAVAPGVIKTPLHPQERHEALARFHPLGHLGEVADIAEAVLYLESASFVTGEILHVDGGSNVGS
ncbi:SDR family NAD(P)-dependent oxidoreductase [Paraburkholderia sabiae]|jgi:NAD(P)-dependent dehydrogenase (short-subunit alcohol dehydrogenase family)|uniref:SDR family oxidoreductase n=1 Tax=Paraburkholderia sabiae TaxID=273251 RepID=A0ABU9Q9H7_9BURK|nr:SDR family oxidoreductase [Paraburkholderia sabiae]WJZ78675.1 SDR family oxidoreductase [Paraburkholderia sabiae]CAD6511096.1 3-beta-hydroxycholanate 3-dehydrogenase (NAD(+)) 1 [Paraburkholderia sabiae]CAG9207276.1 Short-chain dehydrogenase/reductase SDR [Paraburkholderia sabiae]